MDARAGDSNYRLRRLDGWLAACRREEKRALLTLAGNPSRKDRKELKNAKNSLANFVPVRLLRENPVLLSKNIVS